MASAKVFVPVRQPGQTSCVHHSDRTVTLFCELCEDLVCLTCLSTVHKGHEMCALSELTAATRIQIQKYIDNTEKQQCVQLQLLINWAENEFVQTLVKYRQLTETIERQGEILKHQIDVFTRVYKGFYRQLEEENTRNLEAYITVLRSRLDAQNDNLRNCKHILVDATDIQTYDVGHKLITQPEEIPVQPKCHCYTFIPNKATRNYLEHAFGKLTTSAQHKPRIHTKKLSEFTAPDFISSICPNGDDGAWVCNHGNTVTLLDKQGKKGTVLSCKLPIREVQISPTTGNLWMCTDSNYKIIEWNTTSKETPTRFLLDSECYNLCVTADEHILVGMSKKITKFTPCGTALLTSGAAKKTSFFQRSVPLVRSAYRITECCVTRHVAVIDMDREEDCGHSQKQVLVMDKDFRQILSYRGGLRKSEVGFKVQNSFSPCDIKFDTFGHLLISDKSNGCIHLLTGEGQFIRLIYVNDKDAGVICLDHQNV